MPVAAPQLWLSDSDKALLRILSRIAMGYSLPPAPPSNLAQDAAPLGDEEARELLQLLEALLTSYEFRMSTAFVQGLVAGKASDDGPREIYLSERKRRGRTRVLASRRWAEFEVRLGLRGSHGYLPPDVAMSLETFFGLERRLLDAAGIHKRVVDVAIGLLQADRRTLEDLRRGRRSLGDDAIRSLFVSEANEIRRSLQAGSGREIKIRKLVGMITIVSNMGALFTTRDWSVAGTLSTLAGVVVASVA